MCFFLDPVTFSMSNTGTIVGTWTLVYKNVGSSIPFTLSTNRVDILPNSSANVTIAYTGPELTPNET